MPPSNHGGWTCSVLIHDPTEVRNDLVDLSVHFEQGLPHVVAHDQDSLMSSKDELLRDEVPVLGVLEVEGVGIVLPIHKVPPDHGFYRFPSTYTSPNFLATLK